MDMVALRPDPALSSARLLRRFIIIPKLAMLSLPTYTAL